MHKSPITARDDSSQVTPQCLPIFPTQRQSAKLTTMEIQFTTRVFKEGRTYVAHTPELDVSSCGGTKEKAVKNLKEAVRLFLEEAEKMGSLKQILKEAGYSKSGELGPKFISVQRVTLPLSLTHAKA